ncbi:hypothetical protein BH747_12025 [Enterococcus villorum]|uniref:HTH cro/C1-type domain-containing protein n=1 Tax=Enterococcus villorum TaxID=112904 RepID=A0A1V8Y714_9ENTE|nr:helix-turn-helix transcriptional regulator [Enterococcus villorum]OQO68403.1 hypothetical protein BH747_12025 [Enterococcus villorum]OQO74350.1 hypothetical protein BH744_07375 [Enterococcus villorum]
MQHLGINIKKLRRKHGMTQLMLAEAIGKTSTYISKLENNETRGNLDTLSDIARAFSVSLNDLLKEPTKEGK